MHCCTTADKPKQNGGFSSETEKLSNYLSIDLTFRVPQSRPSNRKRPGSDICFDSRAKRRSELEDQKGFDYPTGVSSGCKYTGSADLENYTV